MKAFKFTAKISEKGTIQIPFETTTFDKEVEVIILPKADQEKGQMKASKFVEKWAGFLNEDDTDAVKLDYLSKKYN